MESIFKKVIKKITNRVKMLFMEPNPEKIYHVNFAVTYKCNSRCKHCNIWKKYNENTKIIEKELKLAEIKKIFKESQYLKYIQSIGLTGGEPFLRKDFTDLCGFFIEKFPNATISISNNA
ncbi:radical SAM protein, partial [bacterium]|nr:radical SAM protein [bacterium]